VETAAAPELRQAMPAPPSRALPARIRQFAANFWLNYLFWHAEHAQWFVRRAKWFYLWFALRHSHHLNDGPAANARRIFGPDIAPAAITNFTRDVVGNFFDFVYDIGRCRRMSRAQLRQQIESTHGSEHYDAARALKKGAIVVTAHMGSFEVGMAALLQRDEKIHVVFKRDVRDRFEMIRQSYRRRLGVAEAPIDEGWTIWMRLREALLRDEVVVLQGDRVMPGQKGQPVPFLHGHLLLPTGPFKLALASGAPIVPVFSVRTPQGKIQLFIEPAIHVDPAHGMQPALFKLAAVIEKYVAKYPQQWLVVQPAFCEDAPPDQP
jgi:KDO2-lipid IV(A) lauroyltransferase